MCYIMNNCSLITLQEPRCSQCKETLPLTLRPPHGKFFTDIVKALQPTLGIDGGIQVTINGETFDLCIFTLAHVGDMPQQQENSRFKSHKAAHGCR